MENTVYDAIVVGSGMTGGWAAKELTQLGLKTLLLERGRDIHHIKDYVTAFKNPWDFPHRLLPTTEISGNCPIQSRCSAFDESTRHFFVNDLENPYVQTRPFSWIRGHQVGGRSLIWGRQCYRWSDLDFEANLVDGFGVDWPVRYRDLAPWYGYVESFIGVSGKPEGLPHFPDGVFLPPMEMTCVESRVAGAIREKFKDRLLTIGRAANLTQSHKGRGPCQYRNLCARGCPFGGYFSSNAATLPAADATGNLTLRPFSIVSEILFDEGSGRAAGVRAVDAETLKTSEYHGRIIFLNASAIGTAQILLNSKSRRFPEGIGNGSGQIGRNLMDHHFDVGATGEYPGLENRYYSGRRPNVGIIPRFRNVSKETRRNDYVRGYALQCFAMRSGWDRGASLPGVGARFKAQLQQPGPWNVWMGGLGECLPYPENRVTLSSDARDKWGLPLVVVDCSFKTNELAMRRDTKFSAMEMLEAAGVKNIKPFDYDTPPGLCIHEMGTARMGRDPRSSVLNGFNQMHEVKNVFITDGACMASSGWQNPSLTYMALTARACHYATDLLKRGDL